MLHAYLFFRNWLVPKGNFKTHKHKNALQKDLHDRISNNALNNIDNIYNMGNFPLSNDEITVLNRGLSFVIAPEEIRYQTIFDALSDFKRRMFLHYHFFINPTNSEK